MNPGAKLVLQALLSTNTGTFDESWSISDEVIGFREATRSELYYFPKNGRSEWKIGSSSECEMQLIDPAKGISRHHATMKRVGDRWIIEDRESKNGLSIDGIRRTSMPVDPGMQIGIGSLRLIATSYRLLTLRSFLQRLIGWGASHPVDETLQDIRFAQLRRDPLVLQGTGDLIPIAHRLHRILLGEKRPFVLHDPSRVSSGGDGDVRCMKNVRDLQDAIAAAGEGTVCVRSKPLPDTFVRIAVGLREPGRRAPQVIVCDEGHLDPRVMRMSPPIVIPPLAGRPADDVDHVISEYLEDAVREFEWQLSLTTEERAWVAKHSRTVADVEKCVRRLVAFRKRPTHLGAASLLGMTAVSLRRWLRTHPLP